MPEAVEDVDRSPNFFGRLQDRGLECLTSGGEGHATASTVDEANSDTFLQASKPVADRRSAHPQFQRSPAEAAVLGDPQEVGEVASDRRNCIARALRRPPFDARASFLSTHISAEAPSSRRVR